ncbi:MAG TPA: CRISPR system precrRNA processing endoribonuclease RAMP protein Cas6 [Candidatus Obscuribacterales bacterium]
MLLERYELLLSVEGDNDPLWKSPARGALMHGALHALARADNLHSGSNSARPYSQHLLPIGHKRYCWILNVLHRDSCMPILEWLDTQPDHVRVSHYDIGLAVDRIECTISQSYFDFQQRWLDDIPPKFVRLNFLTPTAFKRAGDPNYYLWPDAKMVVQSALSRWNLFGTASKLDDPAILEDVVKHVHVQSYQLISRYAAMDGIGFSGSVGTIAYQIHKNTAVRQVFNLAAAYAEYCGLGIKTAMGLGAIEYERRESIHKKHGTTHHKETQSREVPG